MDPDISYRDYTTSKKGTDLTTDQVEALINSGLSGYADQSYVDAQDAKNATRAYIDAQDNLRLKLANVGLANGPVPLDASGRIPPQYLNVPLTQRYFRGPWSPASYPGGAINFNTETTLFTVNVSDPGYPYQLMIFGTVDCHTNIDGEFPVINVHVGSPTGEIIAQGLGWAGANEWSLGNLGDDFNTPQGGVPAGWNEYPTDVTGGGHYIVNSGNLVWQASGSNPHGIVYQRAGADAVTATDYQKISTVIAAQGMAASGGGNQTFNLYGRLSASLSDYITLGIVGQSSASLGAGIGGGYYPMQNGVNGFVVGPANSVGINTGAGSSISLVCGGTDSAREFYVYNNGVVILVAYDTAGITSMGPAYRGYGFAGHADTRFFGLTQTVPPSLAYVLAGDAGPNFKPVSIVPVNNPNMVVRSGSTTLYVRGSRSGGSSTQTMSPAYPNLYPIAFPAG